MVLKADHYIEIDRSKRLRAQAHKGHNRWHPDIAPIVHVDPGQVIAIETLDAFDLQVNESTTPQQVGECNLNVIHPLTGPIYVNGAEPGDILEVRILEIAPQPFGFTVQVPGFGFL